MFISTRPQSPVMYSNGTCEVARPGFRSFRPRACPVGLTAYAVLAFDFSQTADFLSAPVQQQARTDKCLPCKPTGQAVEAGRSVRRCSISPVPSQTATMTGRTRNTMAIDHVKIRISEFPVIRPAGGFGGLALTSLPFSGLLSPDRCCDPIHHRSIASSCQGYECHPDLLPGRSESRRYVGL